MSEHAAWLANEPRATYALALAAIEAAAAEGVQDTRVLEIRVKTAMVYALLAIADAMTRPAS